ncbi:murein biosynthesis integral membrane protein MurJ [Uliginosibacterium gangwonense]|uniref:murein biosynthesis integral membrane protein MurJ n=1 Tax=Uliginosibacterium gangwonense TaxID=392736 RepID=UPI00036A2FC8|nr:murein biosynthesis integral membrane protein MurJ [Uliginosibacterium gangwonense]
MNLLKALAKVSSFTLLSRILGLVREILIANVLGAGMMTDAFNVAFRLPNLLRRLFAEGAFSQAFVPILGEYKNKQDEASTRSLVNHVTTLLGLAVFIVSAIGILCAPWVIHLTANGFSKDADKFQLAVELTRVTFPYIFFQAMVALSAAVLNTWGRFSLPAFTPVMFNLTAIVMLLFMAPHFSNPAKVLAWSAFIGGVLQMVVQIPALMGIKMMPRFSLSLKDPGVMRILKTMAPATLGVSVAQISLVINTNFASSLPTGSISWLNYADRIMEFPVGLLGAALGTILLPSLSKMRAQSDNAGFSATLDWGLRMALLLTAPAAVGMMLLAVPLASTLFQHGAFSYLDSQRTHDALLAYSVGLIGLILVKILAPAFYSRQDVRTPLKYALISLVATQLMNLAFVVYGPLAHAGLALSIGLAATLNASLLYYGLRKVGAYTPHAGWVRFTGKLIIGLVVMGVVLWLVRGAENDWLHNHHTAWRVTHLFGIIAVGAAAYFATLYALGFRMQDFRRRI